jgi:predicted secreted hydrolase
VSIFDVLREHGTAALARHAALVVLFLILHIIRIPFVLAERVLAGALVRIDRAATAQASRIPKRPVNQFFPDDIAPHTTRKEAPAHA